MDDIPNISTWLAFRHRTNDRLSFPDACEAFFGTISGGVASRTLQVETQGEGFVRKRRGRLEDRIRAV